MKDEFDKKVKQDLKQQAKELDALVDGGLFDYLKLGFDGSFSWIVKLGYAIAIVLSVVMFYCGYKFFTADVEDQVFWGFLTLITFNGQVATKLWIFMHMNRNVISREIRMLELRLKHT